MIENVYSWLNVAYNILLVANEAFAYSRFSDSIRK
jgi:hypothetical protein